MTTGAVLTVQPGAAVVVVEGDVVGLERGYTPGSLDVRIRAGDLRAVVAVPASSARAYFIGAPVRVTLEVLA